MTAASVTMDEHDEAAFAILAPFAEVSTVPGEPMLSKLRDAVRAGLAFAFR